MPQGYSSERLARCSKSTHLETEKATPPFSKWIYNQRCQKQSNCYTDGHLYHTKPNIEDNGIEISTTIHRHLFLISYSPCLSSRKLTELVPFTRAVPFGYVVVFVI